MLLILREVPCDKGIGGYHNIVFFHFCELRGALGSRSHDGKHPQFRREFINLALPVQHQRSRTYDKASAAFGALFVKHQRYRLQCLSKSHIVRENTAQTVRRQRFQPPEPVNLILAQNTVKLFRNADFIGVIQHFTVGTYLPAELRAAFNSDILRGTPKAVEIQHSERRYPDFFFHKGLIRNVKTFSDFKQFGKPVVKD